MPLQRLAAQLYAFAMLFRASPSHCDSMQIFAIPLAIQLISIHHLRYAVPRQAIADQIDSALTSAVANQLSAFPLPFFSMPNKALALRHLAVLCLCCSIPNIAYLCLRESTLLVSFPPHYISMLFAATALQYFAFPQLCFVSPRHAFAAQLKSRHCHAIPLRVYAFCTMPLRCRTMPNSPLP